MLAAPSVHNLAPTYLMYQDVMSKEMAQTLMDLVDEKGKETIWDDNPNCIELQIANPFSEDAYWDEASKDPRVVSLLPNLMDLGQTFLREANKHFNNNVCHTITGNHGFWVMRYDAPGGMFGMHCDADLGPTGVHPPIVATAAILLNDDYEGGETIVLDGKKHGSYLERKKRSAVSWDGWAQHQVCPVTKGSRYVCIVHMVGSLRGTI
jgi:hypothetical protein